MNLFINSVIQNALSAPKIDQDKYTKLLLSVIVIFMQEIITSESYPYIQDILDFLLNFNEENIDVE